MRRLLLLCPLLCLPALAWPKAPDRLYAAAGKADITPEPSKETVWLSGYGARGRRARGVHDPLYARALVVSDGTKTLALVAVDALGLCREDVLDVRRELGWEGPDRYVFIAATHDHSSPDSLGLWGRFIGVSGVDARYHRRLKEKVVELVRGLAGRLQEAELGAASVRLDPGGLCRDLRDPAVLDPELNVLSLRPRGGGKPIGTLVRWSCHAEAMGKDNLLVTADYPGALCSRVERETGGECVFMPGLIGGLLSPDVRHQGVEKDFEAMKALGERVAGAALEGLKKGDRWTSARLGFSTRTVRLPVDNSIYLLFLHSLHPGHRFFDEAGREIGPWAAGLLSLRHLAFFPLPERLRPRVEAELSLIQLGPVRILGVPGELFPELALGGFGGGLSFGAPLVKPANPNPPRLEAAPKGPYLRELLKARHGLIVGPANDEIGYIVPEYDFQASRGRTMHPRPKGTHYEEINSVGPRTAPLLLEACRALLQGSDFVK